MIWIGIDPGKQTGLAFYDSTTRKLDSCSTSNFWDCAEMLGKISDKSAVCVVMEDPNENPPTFHRYVNQRQQLKIAQNVGMNKRDAQLLIELCNRLKIQLFTVRPSSKKWDAKFFTQVTGYAGRTSQHSRDAAKLVYGR